MIDDLYQLHQHLQKSGIIFAFSGPVSQHVIEGIGETLKQKMELEDAGMNTIQKVFSVFVEQMQNVVNYSAETVTQPDQLEGELRIGTLVVGRDGPHFWVQCGNLVRMDQTSGLRNRLDFLRSLNKDELKALYRERRKSAAAPESKGAGLGFIDIARKASRPIEYTFVSAASGMVFFTIKAIIGEES
jgi:hypothetical protein